MAKKQKVVVTPVEYEDYSDEYREDIKGITTIDGKLVLVTGIAVTVEEEEDEAEEKS